MKSGFQFWTWLTDWLGRLLSVQSAPWVLPPGGSIKDHVQSLPGAASFERRKVWRAGPRGCCRVDPQPDSLAVCPSPAVARWLSESVGEGVNGWVTQCTSKSMYEWVSGSVSQWGCQQFRISHRRGWISEPVAQWVSGSVSLWISASHIVWLPCSQRRPRHTDTAEAAFMRRLMAAVHLCSAVNNLIASPFLGRTKLNWSNLFEAEIAVQIQQFNLLCWLTGSWLVQFHLSGRALIATTGHNPEESKGREKKSFCYTQHC